MTGRIVVLMAFFLLPVSIQAASWTVDCPQVQIESPFKYKHIWTPDEEWVEKPLASNQPILMSCGNWKVMGQEMVCYFGGYKTTYDYAVRKAIPEGASCDRGDQCQFKCSSATVPKAAPQMKAPRQRIPQ